MRKFLASVGNAQLLGKRNGEIYHIADIRTLTESTLSFSNTMEDVRAGEGAQLYGRFSHDAGMTCTLTDAMFDLNYIAYQVGAQIEGNATAFYLDEGYGLASNIITPSKTVANIGSACGLTHPVIWVKEKGCDAQIDWVAVMPNESGVYSIADTELAGKTNLCVRYFVNKPEARKISVSGNFIPAECILILTTKLFAGDANAPETGKPVGSITVKIPRFQLDGTFDLSMAMSAAATMSLNGTALAVNDGTCEDKGIYAEIVEVEENSNIMTGLKMISFDNEYNHVGDEPVVYGLYNDGHASILDNAELTFSPALVGGKFNATGNCKVTLGDEEDNITVIGD